MCQFLRNPVYLTKIRRRTDIETNKNLINCTEVLICARDRVEIQIEWLIIFKILIKQKRTQKKQTKSDLTENRNVLQLFGYTHDIEVKINIEQR